MVGGTLRTCRLEAKYAVVFYGAPACPPRPAGVLRLGCPSGFSASTAPGLVACLRLRAGHNRRRSVLSREIGRRAEALRHVRFVTLMVNARSTAWRCSMSSLSSCLFGIILNRR